MDSHVCLLSLCVTYAGRRSAKSTDAGPAKGMLLAAMSAVKACWGLYVKQHMLNQHCGAYNSFS